METCKVCKTQFEPWLATFECNNCEDGIEEVWRDWNFDEPDYRTCYSCKGDGEIQSYEHSFCSEDCREDYFNPHHDEF